MGAHFGADIRRPLKKESVIMSGASAELLPADASRQFVLVCSAKGNGAAAFDPTGGICALDAGVPMDGGDSIPVEGKAAESAMTQIGTAGQKLTVYWG